MLLLFLKFSRKKFFFIILLYVVWHAEFKYGVHFCQLALKNLNNPEKQDIVIVTYNSGGKQVKPGFWVEESKTSRFEENNNFNNPGNSDNLEKLIYWICS